jgi:hypothetical protein
MAVGRTVVFLVWTMGSTPFSLLSRPLFDASFVEPYFSKFDRPKRKSNVAYRVGKKQ